MLRFSANLGFLWTGMPLPDAIRRAHSAGFDAVECHWPYDEDAEAVKAALAETGLAMLGLNTRKGLDPQDFGLAALPGREAEARAAIDEAFGYGARIGAAAVHVMAGKAQGVDGADETFQANLAYACDKAAESGMTVLIERRDGTTVNTELWAQGVDFHSRPNVFRAVYHELRNRHLKAVNA